MFTCDDFNEISVRDIILDKCHNISKCYYALVKSGFVRYSKNKYNIAKESYQYLMNIHADSEIFNNVPNDVFKECMRKKGIAIKQFTEIDLIYKSKELDKEYFHKAVFHYVKRYVCRYTDTHIQSIKHLTEEEKRYLIELKYSYLSNMKKYKGE